MKMFKVNDTTILKLIGDRIIRVQCLTSNLGTPYVRETIFRKGTPEFAKASSYFR